MGSNHLVTWHGHATNVHCSALNDGIPFFPRTFAAKKLLYNIPLAKDLRGYVILVTLSWGFGVANASVRCTKRPQTLCMTFTLCDISVTFPNGRSGCRDGILLYLS